MRDVKLHAALFVVAVVAALLTWNRNPVGESARNLVLAWQHDTTDFRWFQYSSPKLDVRIERRTDESGPFYWGIQTRKDRSPEPLEFPVGWSGAETVPNLTVLRVLRDLGELDAEQRTRFGLADSEVRLTVEFSGGSRELIVGDSVFGGEDRYVLEAATGRGYVISRQIMNQIELGEGALRERMINNFRYNEVAEVRVEAGTGGERTMVRTESDEWMEPGSDVPDVSFGNFMERVDEMAIDGYDSPPPEERLRRVLRMEYLDDGGDILGFLELFRDDLAERNAYYLRSESTRMIARSHSLMAERLEQAVEDIFGR